MMISFSMVVGYILWAIMVGLVIMGFIERRRDR